MENNMESMEETDHVPEVTHEIAEVLQGVCEDAYGLAEELVEQPENDIERRESDPYMELEEDAPLDGRSRTTTHIHLSTSDSTVNVLRCTGVPLVTSLGEGGLQYLLAGVRATAGAKSGCYFFEVRIVESLAYEPLGAKARGPKPQSLVRIGVSLAESSLFLSASEGNVCFDSEGFFSCETQRSKVAPEFQRGQTVGLLLNLDASSSNAHTVSLFHDGLRVAPPQKLPPNLLGKALYPTLTFRGVTLHVNFGPVPLAPLPFSCWMLQQAAEADIEVAPVCDRNEVLLPVGLPDTGVFEWVDRFLESNPGYTELSRRSVFAWASASGAWQPQGGQGSVDRPVLKSGVHLIDEVCVDRLSSVAPALGHNYIVMELEGNLLPEERRKVLERYPAPRFKRVAVVLLGDPTDQEPTEEVRAGPLASETSTKQGSKCLPDIAARALARSFRKFTLPTCEEGFDEVRFAWQPSEKCTAALREWSIKQKLAIRVSDLHPDAWFEKENVRRLEYLNDCRERQHEWKAEKKACGGVRCVEDEDLSIVEDVMDIGNGQPLFANFDFEDWCLLCVRLELHLLFLALRRELDDAERTQFHESHLRYYYQKYFRRALNLNFFGGDLACLLGLVKDTVTPKEAGLLECVFSEEFPISCFVKFTEGERRERHRRVDAGDETAMLKFRPLPRPSQVRRSTSRATGQKRSSTSPSHSSKRHEHGSRRHQRM